MSKSWSLAGRNEMTDKTKFESIKELNMALMDRLVKAEKEVRTLKAELEDSQKTVARLIVEGHVTDTGEEYMIEL